MARISAETKAKIVQAYLENPNLKYGDISKKIGVAESTVANIIRTHLKAGNGITPDRRKGRPDEELQQMHDDVIAVKDPHPRTLDWMEHVKPLNQHKRELEEKVRHKQAELDAARQELRDFTATLKQLMEGTV